MLLAAYEWSRCENEDVFSQMYQLRARQFSERRGWRVMVQSGMERDRFDDLNPYYICVITEERRLLASLRLLPTTGPHMLADVFPAVMGEAEVVRHPLILESSRFCVDTEVAKEFGPQGINNVTRELLHGLFSIALKSGAVNIISVFDVYVEKVLRRAGCQFCRLGPVAKFDDLRTVGGLFEVSEEVVQSISPDNTQRLLQSA